MYLTKEEEHMIQGKVGESKRLAMEILVKIGEAYKAERMVNVSGCHVLTSMAPDIHQARTDLLKTFCSVGGHYSVPTTLDPASYDFDRWREFKVPEEYREKAAELLRINDQMGATPNYSCVPYQQGLSPRFGEFVSFVESSYIVFSNSVIGARANRETNGIVVAASIAGRVPLYGLRLTENRFGEVLVRFKGLDPSSFDTNDYGTIGCYLGEKLGYDIPVIEGFSKSVTTDQLKIMGASAACKGCVAMYHAVGITPEAKSREEAFGGEKPKDVLEITSAELRQAREDIPTISGGKIDAVLVGCPHYSISQIGDLASLLSGRKIHRGVMFVVYTTREAKALSDRMGFTRTIEGAGGIMSVGTCSTLAPVKYCGFNTIMTDSPKCAYTSPVDAGVDVIFGSIRECVEASLKGEA